MNGSITQSDALQGGNAGPERVRSQPRNKERMVIMTYRIHDIYNTIGEAKAQIAEYIADDNSETEPRTSTVTYIVIDENGENVTDAE